MEKELQELLEPLASVEAVWLGGSKATNREDNLSDIDLIIVTDDPSAIFKELENFLNQKHKVTHKWELGKVLDKGYEQAFYVLSGFHEFFYIDTVIFKSPHPKDLSEYFYEERHGIPYILFDKTGLLQKAKELTKKISPPRREHQDELGQFEVMHRTFLKEARRGHYIDSFTFYHRMVFQLVSFLRRSQSPDRFDFGTRYLYSDLKPRDSALIENLLKVSSLEEMKEKALLIKERLNE